MIFSQLNYILWNNTHVSETFKHSFRLKFSERCIHLFLQIPLKIRLISEIRVFNLTNNQDMEIIAYTPQYKKDFKRLNVEWISTYFTLESHNLEQLDDPEGYI